VHSTDFWEEVINGTDEESVGSSCVEEVWMIEKGVLERECVWSLGYIVSSVGESVIRSCDEYHGQKDSDQLSVGL